uniref:Uncharacterized protein n=1 Tax=Oryza rufipogon TaxID=4529 RepID=A0A0E0PCM3_ORYRU
MSVDASQWVFHSYVNGLSVVIEHRGQGECCRCYGESHSHHRLTVLYPGRAAHVFIAISAIHLPPTPGDASSFSSPLPPSRGGCVEILPIAMAMAILPLSRTLLTSAAMAILPLARTSLTSQRGWRLGAVQPESVHQPRCDERNARVFDGRASSPACLFATIKDEWETWLAAGLIPPP